MVQVEYNPVLRKIPLDYYNFCNMLMDECIKALEKSASAVQTEILSIRSIKSIFVRIKRKK